MSLPLLLLGVFLLLLVLADLLWTTMGEGGGPVTKRVTSLLWGLALRVHHRWPSHRLLSIAGLAVFLSAVVLWIALLWVGWLLVFNSSTGAVVHAQTKAPADVWERVYFTGFTIFTLGTGDYQPSGRPWQVLTALASFNGLFLVTFSITYLVPVVQAATHKRYLAVYISSLGQSAQAILVHSWDGEGFTALGQHLAAVTSDIAHLEQRHLAYPVLHYLHAKQRPEGIALSLSALDEALTILAYGVEPEVRLEEGTFRPAQQVITEFLETLSSIYIDPEDEAPPPPSLAPLRERGIPVVSDEVFEERVARLDKRRRLLKALVRNNGWSWDTTHPDLQGREATEPLSAAF